MSKPFTMVFYEIENDEQDYYHNDTENANSDSDDDNDNDTIQ